MRNLLTLTVAFLTINLANVLLAANAESIDDTKNRKIQEINQQIGKAYEENNTIALDMYLADDYTHVNPMGALLNKSELLTALQSNALVFVAYEMKNVTVRRFGNIAILTGQLYAKASRGARDMTGYYEFIRVLNEGKDGWQEVAFQVTRDEEADAKSELNAIFENAVKEQQVLDFKPNEGDKTSAQPQASSGSQTMTDNTVNTINDASEKTSSVQP